METVVHHGRETAYAGPSDGAPTVLLVHGSGSTHEIWHRQLAADPRAGFAALDLSGHGQSTDVDATAGYSTLAAYADDVLAVAASVDARVLVGHSMGGAVVMHALLERQPDVDGVVLTSTGARLGVLEDLLRWLRTDFERAIEFLHGDDGLFHDPTRSDRDLSIELMCDCGRAITRRDFLTCHRFDVRDRLGEIPNPTVVGCGPHDRLTPPWYHEFLVDELPDAELVVFADSGHHCMLERPDAYTATVDAFACAVAE